MFTNKLGKLFMLLSIVVAALLTVSFASSPKASPRYPDYALRHPGELIIPVTGNLNTWGSDYYQRHPELSVSALLGVGASDYFQRHPELVAPAEASVDLTDYYFRQAALQPSSTNIDLTDYFFRHR